MDKQNTEYLDNFEARLEAGAIRICSSSGLIPDSKLAGSEDIDGKWEEYIKDYVSDAVRDFAEFPDAAISWAAFLGMAVANHWDRDWELFKDEPYTAYYGSRGWDDMDEHIVNDVLKLSAEQAKKVNSALQNCSQAIRAFLQHENIQVSTALGFYALVRVYGVMYRVGAAIELNRLGYKMVPAALPGKRGQVNS